MQELIPIIRPLSIALPWSFSGAKTKGAKIFPKSNDKKASIHLLVDGVKQDMATMEVIPLELKPRDRAFHVLVFSFYVLLQCFPPSIAEAFAWLGEGLADGVRLHSPIVGTSKDLPRKVGCHRNLSLPWQYL